MVDSDPINWALFYEIRFARVCVYRRGGISHVHPPLTTTTERTYWPEIELDQLRGRSTSNGVQQHRRTVYSIVASPMWYNSKRSRLGLFLVKWDSKLGKICVPCPSGNMRLLAIVIEIGRYPCIIISRYMRENTSTTPCRYGGCQCATLAGEIQSSLSRTCAELSLVRLRMNGGLITMTHRYTILIFGKSLNLSRICI